MIHGMWVHAFSISAIVLYVVAVILLYNGMLTNRKAAGRRAVIFATLGFILQAAIFAAFWRQSAVPDHWQSMFNLSAWVTMGVILVSHLTRQSLFPAALVALPLSIAAMLLTLASPEPANGATLDQSASLHIGSAILAMAFFSIAAVFAVFSALLDSLLKRHQVSPLVRALPPLETLEFTLVRLVILGQIALTFALASGFIYIDDLFAQHLAHKTILSLLAWVVFSLLLLARWKFGLRGRRLIGFTLAGMALLLLSYFGSKLVLEQVFGRRWAA